MGRGFPKKNADSRGIRVKNLERETGLEPATFTLASGMPPVPTPNEISDPQGEGTSLAPVLAPETGISANAGSLEALAAMLRNLSDDDRRKLAGMLAPTANDKAGE